MFKEHMMKRCCGPDGEPDLDKMRSFMERHDQASMVDTIGWALFFVWVGIAWLAELDFGVSLLGVAVITLGGQLARKLMGFKFEGFWVIVGLLFALGGIWELTDIEISLVPILLIIVGLALVGSLCRQWLSGSEKS